MLAMPSDAVRPCAHHALRCAGTPADLILDMMASLLTGRTPSPEDVLSVRSAILQARDIYTPMDVQERIARSQLDVSAPSI